MITLKEVAREAGLQVSTVSEILRDSPRYNSATRAQVKEIAQRLGYRANVIAQSMVRGRTHSVGIVSPMAEERMTAAPERFHVLSHALQEAGYQILTSYRKPGDWEHERNLIEGLRARRVDGLILFNDSFCDPTYYDALVARQVPLVLWAPTSPPTQAATVFFDSRQGMYDATRHLLDLGHRHIVYATSKASFTVPGHRIESFHRALNEAGVPIRKDYLPAPEPSSREAVQAFTRQVLREKPRPTAIMYQNDETALVGLHAILAMGLRVPEDVSVVGFDDVLMAQLTWPELTTVRQSSQALAHATFDLLMDQIQNPKRQEQPHLFLKTELIVRGSTGPVPDGKCAKSPRASSRL